MITFTLSLPKISSDQRLLLEKTLLSVAKVDALPLADGTGDFAVTTTKDALRDMVSALYGWSARRPAVHRLARAICGEKTLVLGKTSPNEVIHFLTLCDH